jgi:hypothetical protein
LRHDGKSNGKNRAHKGSAEEFVSHSLSHSKSDSENWNGVVAG